MGDKDVTRRINRATASAITVLKRAKFKIRLLDGKPFHIEAIRKREIRNIRITIDEILKEEERLVANYELPDNCSKEIWCRKENKKDFNVLTIF